MNEIEEIIDFCAKNNAPVFNYNKAIEETTEFNEVLIKLQTKHPDNPKYPDKNEVLKEYGDMVYRGFIAIKTLFPDYSSIVLKGEIDAHIEMKLLKLIKYKNEGKYTMGL